MKIGDSKKNRETKGCYLIHHELFTTESEPPKAALQWPKVVTSLIASGGCEGVPPKLQGCGKHDPGAFGSSADGLRHRLGTPAPA